MNVFRFFFVTFLCLLFFKVYSQQPETPVINYVTVNHSTNKVEINWKVTDNSSITGFIVKRKILDGSGVVLGTMNTISTISNNSTFFYEDISTDYNTISKPDLRSETYSVVSYKDNGGSLTFSNLSEFHSTIFLTSTFDACTKNCKLVWNKYTGWNPGGYEVYFKKVVDLNFQLLATTSDTTYNYQVNETNQNYLYYVKAVGNLNLFSESNISEISTSSSLSLGYINADFATVNSPNAIDLSFTISQNNSVSIFKLVHFTNSDDYDTIAEFDGNLTNVTYTHNSSELIKHYYKLIAFDNCNTLIGESNISSNIVLNTSLQNSETRANLLTWSAYEHWRGNIENYNIFMSFEDEEFTELTTISETEISYLHDITDYIFDIYNGGIPKGKFCYYVEATETANPYEIAGISKSNISCIIQEPIAYFPTAFNPNSNIDENKVFKPKMTFMNNYLLIIYSKWGSKVFETTEPSEGWTGKSSSGKLMMRGTYTYYVRFIDEYGKRTEKSGYVNLMY